MSGKFLFEIEIITINQHAKINHRQEIEENLFL